MALMAGLLTIIPGATAQQLVGAGIPGNRTITSATGIRTDRLSPRQRRIWSLMSGIVFATDASGNPLHPKLQALWRSVDESGSTIFIEMAEPARGLPAGLMRVEESFREEPRHTLSIRLYLGIIRSAVVSERTRRADGFTPFKGLNPQERYVEVLAHELEHAARAIGDPGYMNLIQEHDRLIHEVLSSLRNKSGRLFLDPDNRQRVSRLQTLDDQVESPANRMEMEVWQELVNQHRAEPDARS